MIGSVDGSSYAVPAALAVSAVTAPVADAATPGSQPAAASAPSVSASSQATATSGTHPWYFSPNIVFDIQSQKIVIYFYNSNTGSVELQIPSRKQLNAYRREVEQEPPPTVKIPAAPVSGTGVTGHVDVTIGGSDPHAGTSGATTTTASAASTTTSDAGSSSAKATVSGAAATVSGTVDTSGTASAPPAPVSAPATQQAPSITLSTLAVSISA